MKEFLYRRIFALFWADHCEYLWSKNNTLLPVYRWMFQREIDFHRFSWYAKEPSIKDLRNTYECYADKNWNFEIRDTKKVLIPCWNISNVIFSFQGNETSCFPFQSEVLSLTLALSQAFVWMKSKSKNDYFSRFNQGKN